MSNALIPYNEVEKFGNAMVASGYFKDAGKISQAIVKIQAGAEIGLPPFASMSGIHIIQGKPVLGANLLATLIKNDPRYDYRIKTLTNDGCVIDFYENGEIVGQSIFTLEDAQKAKSKNLDKFPRNMLFARAISNGSKWFTPGIFGGMPVYTPDEFGLEVDPEGDVVNGEVVVSEPESEQPGNGPTWEDPKKDDQATKREPSSNDIEVVIGAAEFAVQFAESHPYFKDNFHVIGTLKKVTGDKNIGVTFNNYGVDELAQKLEDYAESKADTETK